MVRQIEAVKLQHKPLKYKLNECMYGFVGVGLLGFEFFQCKNSFGSTCSISLGFNLYHLPPSLSDIHVENDKYADWDLAPILTNCSKKIPSYVG